MPDNLDHQNRAMAQVRARWQGNASATPQGPLLGRLAIALSRAIVSGRSNALLVLQDETFAHDAVVRAAVGAHDSASAGALLQTEIGQIIGELVPQVPLMQMNATDVAMNEKSNARRLPRVSTGAAAAFVAEGSAIPATSAVFDSLTFNALAKVAALVAFTSELTKAPDGAAIIQTLLLDALAKEINRVSLSSNAATAAAPAGLFGLANAAAPIVSTDLRTDVMALAGMLAANYPLDEAAWVLHPAVALKIAAATNAAGALAFPTAQSGVLLGARILTSTGADPGRLGLVHEPSILRAVVVDATGVEVSDGASVQMDSAPAADQGGATGNVVTAWQRDMLSVRARGWAQWASARMSAVQHVEGIAW